MSVIKIEKTENYTVMSNHAFRDPNMSSGAKGLYGYLMTLPNDWEVFQGELPRHFSDGRDAIRSKFSELEEAGYIHREEFFDKGLKRVKYTVTEFPKRISRFGSSEADKPNLLNTNKENTDRISELEESNSKEEHNNVSSQLIEEFTEAWNRLAPTPIIRMTAARRTKIRTRLKDEFFRDNWKAALEQAHQSDFLMGRAKDWKMDIDWFTKNDDNIVRILEGKYNNKNEKSKTLADGTVDFGLSQPTQW